MPKIKIRQEIVGTVLSLREYKTEHGRTLRLTVKVSGEEPWTAFGSCPLEFLKRTVVNEEVVHVLQGSVIQFSAKLEKTSKPSVFKFNRPTKAKVLEWGVQTAEELESQKNLMNELMKVYY